MTIESSVIELAEALADKAKANEVDWMLAEDGRYYVTLPQFRVFLAKTPETEAEPDIVFEVDSAEGRKLGIVQIKASNPKYRTLQELVGRADSYLKERWVRVLEEAAKSIKLTQGKVGEVVTRIAPPPVPQRPTDDQARRFFEKIAGKWFLNYSRGTETATIDKNGNYFIHVGSKSPALKFRLALNSCDSEFQHVEVAKQELNGKTRQIEVLKVSDNSMEGYAKHDEHKLLYKKT